ncbi:MAG: MCE family protein [Chitinivibrionales bacterium]|nr:MCE family protein [Chitinivibrionales bacterium]
MDDRRLGYIICAILALFLVVVGSYVIKTSYFPSEVRVILFPRIGNLRIEDPVNVHGATVGKIKSVQSHPRGVCVEIMLDKKLTIYKNYSIVTIDKGLMGDRVISITPGGKSFSSIPASDTLQGKFVPGISEAVGLAWRLKEEIHKYQELSTLFLEGKGGDDAPFAEKFNTLVSDIDSLTHFLLLKLPELDSQLSRQLKEIDRIAVKTSIFTREVNSVADGYSTMLEKFINEAALALVEIGELMNTVSSALELVQEKDKTVWARQIEQINTQINLLRKTIKEIEKYGIPLRIEIVF